MHRSVGEVGRRRSVAEDLSLSWGLQMTCRGIPGKKHFEGVGSSASSPERPAVPSGGHSRPYRKAIVGRIRCLEAKNRVSAPATLEALHRLLCCRSSEWHPCKPSQASHLIMKVNPIPSRQPTSSSSSFDRLDAPQLAATTREAVDGPKS